MLPSGCRTYILQRRTKAGRSIRLKIARVGDLTADQARDEARRLIARITIGEDPAEQRRKARAEERRRRLAPTVARPRRGVAAPRQDAPREPWRHATREAYERALTLLRPAADRRHEGRGGRAPARARHPRAAGRSRSRRTGRWRRSGRCSGWAVKSDDWALAINPAVGIGMHHERIASATRRTASWSGWSPRCSAGATGPGSSS